MKVKTINTITNKAKGITLIALVITIIVLLILAGVTIATLTGDNGLLQKASDAKQANEEAEALEKIKVEVAGSYGLDGKIDAKELNKNLKKINGLKYKNEQLSEENLINLPAIIELDNNTYLVTNTGTVTPIQAQEIGTITKNNYGDYIDLGQSVVGTTSTTDDWRILFNDKNNTFGGTNGARVYAMLADYLPNNNPAVTNSGLNVVDGTIYSVNSTTDRQDLFDRLNNTTAWQILIPERLRSTGQVKGATTADLIMASYNEKYGTSLSYTDSPYFRTNQNDNSSSIDTLYMPHPGSGDYNGCCGYWTTSPRADNPGTVWRVRYDGLMGYDGYIDSSDGICPVVSLPSNLQITTSTSNGKTIWTLVP